MMRVSIRSDEKPPEALVREAARGARAGGQVLLLAGLHRLHRTLPVGLLVAADLAHDRAYLGCECSLLDEETVIIPLTRAHRRSDSHDHEDFLVGANYKVFTIMKRGARIGI